MNVSLVIKKGGLTNQIRNLQDESRKVRPSMSRGTRTQDTTRGVIREAEPVGDTAGGTSVPRWG